MVKTKRGTRAGKNTKTGPASPWVTEIQNATFFVLDHGRSNHTNGDDSTSPGNNNNNNSRFKNVILPNEKKAAMQRVDHSLAFLNNMSTTLHQNAMQWPPNAAPPTFCPLLENNHPLSSTGGGLATPTKMKAGQSSRESSKTASHASSTRNNHNNNDNNNNAFASLALSDDEEDDDDEAGDFPVHHSLSPEAKPFVPKELDTLRLLIRVFSAQADLYAHKARLLGMNREWLAGASALQSAIGALQNSMGLADGAITQYMMQEVEGMSFFTAISSDNSSSRRKHELMQDSDIVQITAISVKKDRDQYLQLAKLQAERLQRQVEEQWRRRQEAMDRIGRDKWHHNPNPKNTFAPSIQKLEDELRVLQETVSVVATQDAEVLSVTAQHLKEKLQALWYQKNRYNGKSVKKKCGRLPGFVNPTDFDWGFTGSSDDKVEFFEKQLMEEVPPGSGMMALSILKLDWFLKTGVAKITMEHPAQGSIPLLDSVVTPAMFRHALANPLSIGSFVDVGPAANSVHSTPKWKSEENRRPHTPNGNVNKSADSPKKHGKKKTSWKVSDQKNLWA